MQYEGRTVSCQEITSDQTFFDMMGFRILRDNRVTSENACFLNEQALKEFELEEDAETFPYYDNRYPVAGIIKDFQLRNITFKNQPVLYRIRKVEEIYIWDIVAEVQGDPFAAYKEIDAVYKQVTGLDFNGEFMDEQIAGSFEAQRRTSVIVSIFAGIAIIISLLGLLAMSTYFIQQRAREIAIRKVFGSTNGQMLKRLVFTFLNYVWIAFVIAVPVVWYAMQEWLSGYDYRITLGPLIFVAAGLFCLIISFVTVFVQSYYAANANPVKRLKTE
jgi:putative ABC transport system permease protein